MNHIVQICLSVSLVFILGACLSSGPTPPSDAQAVDPTATVNIVVISPPATPTLPPATETPVPVEPEGDASMPIMLFFDIADRIEMGTSLSVPLVMFGTDVISEASVALRVSTSALQLKDSDLELPGIQVVPGVLPEEAVVSQNQFTEEGIVYYTATGLGAGGQITRTLLTMRFAVAAPITDIVELEFLQVTLLGADGAPLPVQPQGKWIEVVAAGPSVTPKPVMPTPTPVVPPASGSGITPGIYHRLQRGQTMFRVAETFGVTVLAIAEANGIADAASVPAGTLLRIPQSPPIGQAAYFVAPNETLYSIARQFGLAVEVLAQTNNLVPPYAIQAGQWIVLVP